jgi:leucyl-tRNA synthetase
LNDIKPVSVIELEGYSEVPSYDVISKMNIKTQNDPQLENATREVYNKELSIGRMRKNTLNYSGLSVSIARNKINEELHDSGEGNSFYEILNRPLVCRCGTHCTVKILENQWFINYGDKNWKDLTNKCLNKMAIVPDDIRTEFKHTIGWLKQKACARKHGLGTKLPWDKEWIIESLSDSVIYMAYYTFSKFINQHNISSDQLNKGVFDYVLLGVGQVDEICKNAKIDLDLLKKMREEFLYFYPLNTRHSGRDLVPNHLTFFIFNHVAIFPTELWPLQIVINGSVLMEGKKMSKSFGNIIPLREAIKTYSADALRLTILTTAELLQDVNFSKNLAKNIKSRLENFYTFALEIIDRQKKNIIEYTNEDKWLLSRLHKTVEAATEAMGKLRIRECINLILYELDQDVQWYLKLIHSKNSKREDTVGTLLFEILDIRVRMLSPFAPFICEEIWEKMGNKGFVSLADWPKSEKSKINLVVEEAEELIKNTLEDTLNITKVTKKKPNKICYYISSDLKWNVYHKVLEVSRLHNFDLGNMIKEIMKDQKLRTKEVQEFIRKIYDEIRKLPDDMKMIRLELNKSTILEFFHDSKSFFERQTGAKVEIYQEDESQVYDPCNKARLSNPFRAGIYIE